MSYELDEIIPVSRGGDPLDIDNVAPAHRCCNQRKGNKLPCDLADGNAVICGLPQHRMI